jgi:dipeptidase E
MKLLLTSGGVTNRSIEDALVELLGKPIAESSALCIPTAMYAHPSLGPGAGPWRFISGNTDNRMVELGWQSMGVLELTALPTLDEQMWVPWSSRPTHCWSAAATCSTCATGCGNRGWWTSCRR